VLLEYSGGLLPRTRDQSTRHVILGLAPFSHHPKSAPMQPLLNCTLSKGRFKQKFCKAEAKFGFVELMFIPLENLFWPPEDLTILGKWKTTSIFFENG
jgi:hypothetical protein